MMTPKRILLVAYIYRKSLGRFYFGVPSKLANGFVRNGDNVMVFSDRDVARESTPFNTQRLGARRMADKLIETAAHYRPHLVLVGHADMLRGETFEAIRAAVPGVRLGCFSLDALFRTRTMEAFSERALHMDKNFITTGDRVRLAGLGIKPGTLHFLPNPVDESIETGRAFSLPREALAYDSLFLGTPTPQREDQLRFLEAAMPAGYRFLIGGRTFGRPRIESTDYLDIVAATGAAPNLPHDDSDPAMMPRLYSSDRIAQLLGQGVATLCHATSGLDALYDDGILQYRSRPELAEAMIQLHRDDALRRRIGETGWRIARARTGVQRVAAYVRAVMLDEPLPEIFWDGSALA